MKLQPASRKEVKRIAIGTAVCDGIMIAALFLLSQLGIGVFHPAQILLGAAGGSLVAILNFTILCLTIQNAVNISQHKRRKAFLQGSYNGRLLLQGAWVATAFLIPAINVTAASLPLLFPNLTVFCLHNGRSYTSEVDF